MKKNPAGQAAPATDRAKHGLARTFDQAIVQGSSDRAGISALAEMTFPGEDLSSAGYLSWMYDRNPNGQAIEFVTKTGDLVTGHCAAVPVRSKIGAGIRAASVAVNGMTHPDFRGRGIFSRLYGEITAGSARSGMVLTFGFPNSNSLGACLRHLNYREIGELPLWILPFDIAAILASRGSTRGTSLGRAAGRLGSPFLRLGQALLRPRRAGGDLTIEKTAEFGPEFEGFWNEVKDSYRNCLVRDPAYLNWRFSRHPTRSYEILIARSDGRPAGYLVGRRVKIEGLSWAMIVDLVVADSAEGKAAAKRLAAAYCREARASGIALVGTLMPKVSPAAKALRRLGFLVCPQKLLPRRFPILLSWNGPETAPGDIFEASAWFITLGDYDAV